METTSSNTYKTLAQANTRVCFRQCHACDHSHPNLSSMHHRKTKGDKLHPCFNPTVGGGDKNGAPPSLHKGYFYRAHVPYVCHYDWRRATEALHSVPKTLSKRIVRPLKYNWYMH